MIPSPNRPLVLAIFGSLLIALGALLSIFWPVLLQRLINKELSLSATSQSFEIWSDSTKIPLHMEIYFFNWTNPHELKIAGKKPSFNQLGPYTFLERREKVNITFHPENSTVSFDQKRTWFFDEARSNGSLNDMVTQLNVVALSAAHKVRFWPAWKRYAMSTVMGMAVAKINEIHVTKTVDELLFSGYQDALIDLGQLGGQMVDVPPFDRFGWFYMRNGSTAFDGHFNMATGQDNIKDVGTLRYWNYKNTSNFFKSPCNAIEGSAGEFWGPERTKDEITLFSADICRPLIYEYEETAKLHGVVGYKYAIGDKTLSNNTKRSYPHEQAKYFESPISSSDGLPGIVSEELSKVHQEPDVVNVGECYCSGDCIPYGLLNASACRYGAPAFVSLPHFYKADPIYRDAIQGMNPDADKHNFYITLEPTTGVPIDVAARLQINILLQPSSDIGIFSDVPKIFFPMFWFNEHVGITEDLASSLKLFLQLPSIGFYSSIAMVVVGSLIVIGAGVSNYLHKRRTSLSSLKQSGLVSAGQKTELVYLDTTLPSEDNQTRLNRQLCPKLTNDKDNF